MRPFPVSFLPLLLALPVLSLACDSYASATVPSCSWPTTLDDGAAPTCSTARAYVQCIGVGESCGALESDPSSSCVGSSASSTTCNDTCALDQYAISCGAESAPDGSAATPQVPAGCQARVTGSSGGASVYCCPCE